jgi:hypothetical protein
MRPEGTQGLSPGFQPRVKFLAELRNINPRLRTTYDHLRDRQRIKVGKTPSKLTLRNRFLALKLRFMEARNQ